MDIGRLLKKTGLYFIGNLASKMMVALLIPIYAFFVKSEELGYFDYTQTIMNILIPIIFLSIWDAILKFLLNKESKHNKDQIISTSLFWVLGINIIGIIFSIVLFYIIDIKYFGLVLMMMIAYSMSQVFQYYARAMEKNSVYVLASICGTLINFLLVVILVILMKKGIIGLYLSYILGQASIVLIIQLKLNILGKFKFKYINLSLLGDMLKFSAPLVLNTISAWLINGYGKFIVNLKLGEFENGLYSFSSKFPLIITTLGSIIAMAITEEAIISSSENDFDKKFNVAINKLFKIFAFIVSFGIPLIYVVFNFFKNTEYIVTIDYIIILMAYAFFTTLGINIGAVFQAINKTKYQFITTLIGGIICVILSFALIKYIGIYAVLISQFIGMLITFISRYIFSRKYIKIQLDKKVIFFSLGMFALGSISYFIKYNIFLLLLMLFIITILFIVFNKDLIISLINIFMRKLKKGRIN